MIEMNFPVEMVGVADHDKRRRRFPEPQEFILARAGLAPIQQRLVSGEVLGRGRQREVNPLHGGEYSGDLCFGENRLLSQPHSL